MPATEGSGVGVSGAGKLEPCQALVWLRPGAEVLVREAQADSPVQQLSPPSC